MRSIAIALTMVAAIGAAPTGTAEAQEPDMEFDLSDTKQGRKPRAARPKPQSAFRLEAYGRFTFAGSLSLTYDDFGPGPAPGARADLNPALGLGGGFEYVLHDFFSIGARAQLHYIDVSDADGGGVFFDTLAVPRGRYTFEKVGLTAYGSIPIGFSVISHDYASDQTAVAFTLGLLGGADYFVSKTWALFAEFGLQWHTHGVSSTGLGDASADVTYLFMHFGAKLAL